MERSLPLLDPVPARRLSLALVLVLAGCSAATAAGSGTPPATPGAPHDAGLGPTAPPPPTPGGGPAADAAVPPAPAPAPVPDPQDVAPAVACPAGAEAAFAAAADAFEAALRRDGIPGASIAMLCGGERVLARAIGVTRAGGAEAVTDTTRFQIASTTKTLTALTAALMADEGAVALDAGIEALVPSVEVRDVRGASCTLEQLLSHSAGFPPDVAGWSFETDTLAGLFELNPRVTLLAPPGAVWNYANYGFSLAGLALERAGGAPFGQLVERHAMTAAGMTDATMDARRLLAEGRFAYGHADENGRSTPIGPLDGYYHSGHYAPTGGAWTTARDLVALARYLIRREQLGAPGVTSVARPRIRTTYPGRSYGLGLFVDPEGNHPWWSHSGSVGGFLSSVDVIPDLGFAVVWVMNGDWPDPDSEAYYPSYALASALTDYDPGPYTEPAAGDIADWVGTYDDPVRLGTLTVRAAAGGAGAELVWSDGTASPIEVSWKDGGYATYPGDGYPVQVTFWRDATGAVVYLVTDLGVGARR